MNYAYKVSVIIPVYNGEKYIERCLESVLNQTLDGIEIICIDDGSTDNTLKLLQKYKSYGNVKIITQKNMGPAAARNIGMKEALGKYIAFVDSDDYIETSMYNEMYNIAEGNQLDIVMCNYVNEYAEKVRVKAEFDLPKETIIDKVNIKKYIYPNLMKDGVYSVLWNNIYKKTLIDACTSLIPENIKYGEDLVFQIKLYDMTNRMYFIDKAFYHYIHRENSLSTKTKNMFESTLVFMYKIRSEYAKKWSISQKVVDYYFIYYSLMDFINSKDKKIFDRLKLYLGNNELKTALKNADWKYKYTVKLYVLFVIVKIISLLEG